MIKPLNSRTLLLTSCVITAISLTACGGGSSSSTATPTVSATDNAVAATAAATSSAGATTAVAATDTRELRLPHWNTSLLSTTGTSSTASTSSSTISTATVQTGTTSTGTTSSTTASTGTGSSSGSTSSTASTSSSTSTGSSVTRPSYSTGDGLFVLNGKLYDQNGKEFRIRGVNRAHWDSDSAAGIAKSGANTVRWAVDFTQPAANNVSLIQSQSIQNNEVPIIGNWTATCKGDTASLQAAVATWVSQAPQWTALNKYMIINIANEWGPTDSTTWRDSYISAIASLRAAGYTGPLLIDSGSCGQDMGDLTDYSAAVFNSDPEKNVIFALHVYAGTNDYQAGIQSVQKGNPTIVTLNSSAATHPFAASYNGTNNSWTPVSAFEISGAQGMTQLNGMQPSPGQHVGGTPGAWTITLNVDSTNWPAYTGGGTVIDYNNNYAMETAHMAALAQTTGAAYIVGEFGPGGNIGPSPTMVTPAEVITASEANGIGWLAWAWDDTDESNCQADNNWFSMTYNCGVYTQASDLTNFGQNVVLNPVYGITALSQRSSIY